MKLGRMLFACRRYGIRLTQNILVVSVSEQKVSWLVEGCTCCSTPSYAIHRRFRASTSRYGVGQVANSNCTPLGLHRIAQKAGGGFPIGTVFESREPVGLTRNGMPKAGIAHRILWLDGLEPGVNRGGNVDTFQRYIYIHGVGDETTLGKPASKGCVHLAAADLMPLYQALPIGTLIWIER